MSRSRTFGYTLASTDYEIESLEAQAQIIERYAGRLGRRIDAMYADGPRSENLRLLDREAGKRLILALRRGDHVIAARLDRLDRSLKGFTRVLDAWSRQGVVAHICDLPITVIDPGHPQCRLLIEILAKFAERERRMLGQQTRQGLAVLKSENRRYCRNAPYGTRWERRGNSTVLVADLQEKALCIKAAELKAEGYSIDKIRQYLSYKCKARNRNGKEFSKSAVHSLAIRGAKWLNSKPPEGA
jgi:DNA invertase Pin-like site-specific DNA recombinase